MVDVVSSWDLLQNKLRKLNEVNNKDEKVNLLREIFMKKFNNKYILDLPDHIRFINNQARKNLLEKNCTIFLIEELKIFSRSSLETVLEVLNYNINNYFRLILNDHSNRDKDYETYLGNLLVTYDLENLNFSKNLLVARLLCLIAPQMSKNILKANHKFLNNGEISNKRLLILLGKGKTGTTSLFSYLSKAFDIKYYHGKEIDYWDIYSKLSLDFEWYRLHFTDLESGELKHDWIDASPSNYGSYHKFVAEKNNLEPLNPIYIITKRADIPRIVSLIQHDIRNGKIDGVSNFSDFQKNVLNNSLTEKEILEKHIKDNQYISDNEWVKSFGKEINIIENKDLKKSYIDNLFQSFGYSKKNETDFPKINVNKSNIPLQEDFIKLIKN